MPSVEDAVVWAIDYAEDDTNGYSMPHRQDPDKADCTSLTARAFKQAGFDVDVNDYSGNMLDDFTSAGFTAIPAGDLDKPDGLIRGDVLLAVSEHAAIYIGDGQLVEASWDYDGEDGDSSGREIHIGDYYSHPWDWILRWEGEEDMAISDDDLDRIAEKVWVGWSCEGQDTPFDQIFSILPRKTWEWHYDDQPAPFYQLISHIDQATKRIDAIEAKLDKIIAALDKQ